MRVKKSQSKHSTSYMIIKDVYVNGKKTTKVVEALGNDKEILEKHPGVDPYEWAKQYAKTLTDKEKEKKAKIVAKFDPHKPIPKNDQRSFNVGYLFLQSLYHQLKLDKVCRIISDKHNFSYDLNTILSRLIYMRILNARSKKGTFECAQDLLEAHEVESQHIYRALDVLAEESNTIEEMVYQNSLEIVERNQQVLYYDCTNFYFEIEEAEGLKQYGMSKENRPNPIVQMGLFMDGNGLPLSFVIHSGNQNEQPSLKPLEKRIIRDFNLSQFIVCTDAGLSSHDNRLYNSFGNRGFITTQSIKLLKKHLKEWALDTKDWLPVGESHRSSRKINLEDLDLEKDKGHYYKERWIHENGLEQRLIITFSPKHKRYQEEIRRKQIERAMKKADNPSQLKKKRPTDFKRFLKETHVTKEGEIAKDFQVTVDQEKIKEEAKYDGLYGICTNVSGDSEEILKISHRRWEIEETFRILKSEMRARPVFVRKDDRIKAHFLTCFLSLLVYRILEKTLDEAYTCPDIIDTLRKMRVFEYSGEGYIPTYTRTDLTDQLHEEFGFRTDTEIIPQKRMKNILKQTKKQK